MVEKLVLLLLNIKYENMATTGLSKEEVMRLVKANGIVDKICLQDLIIVCPEFMFLSRQGYSATVLANMCRERWIQLLS